MPSQPVKAGLAVGGMSLVVAGIITGILLTPGTPPTYNVPSAYETSTGVASDQCAGVTTWTDANHLYEGFTETGMPPSGTFTVTYTPGGETTAPIQYNASAATIASDVAALDPALSGVTAVSNSVMPADFTGNGPLNTNDVWLAGITALSSGLGTQPLTVNDSGIHSGKVKVYGAGLIDVLRALAPSTVVNFATDGCYEVNNGLTFNAADPAISLDGNPSNTPSENAYLYSACTVARMGSFPCAYADQAGASELAPVLTFTLPSGTQDPSTIEHLQLTSTGNGDYIADAAFNSGILLNGTLGTVINDVDVSDVHGDCMTLAVDLNGSGGEIGPVTNLIVEGFTGATCGRQGISPVSVDQATFCGTNIGETGQPSSWDFEDDSEGKYLGAEYVTVTGLPCDWGGVKTQGCTFGGLVSINTNPAASGPILFNDCQVPTFVSKPTEGYAVSIQAESSTASVIPNGQMTFTDDQFKCFANGSACIQVGAPFTAAVRSTILEVGSPGTTQNAYAVSNQTIGGTVYGGTLHWASNCISGYISNLTSSPVGGTVGSASFFYPVNVPYPPPMGSTTGYFTGSKTLCTVVP